MISNSRVATHTSSFSSSPPCQGCPQKLLSGVLSPFSEVCTAVSLHELPLVTHDIDRQCTAGINRQDDTPIAITATCTVYLQEVAQLLCSGECQTETAAYFFSALLNFSSGGFLTMNVFSLCRMSTSDTAPQALHLR